MLKDGPMPGIKTLATHFLSHGVKLTIVDDGPSRHHSKKATILRDGICKQARILDCILLHAELLKLVQQSRNPHITQADSIKIATEIKSLEKRVATKENLIRNRVAESKYRQYLEEGIDERREERKLKEEFAEIEYIQARTQADAVICYHAINNLIDGAIANDSDFAVVAGRKVLHQGFEELL